MISFREAHDLVMRQCLDLGTESVTLKEAVGRVLADEIYADRDYPPFDRATKDGIAINYRAVENGRTDFEVEGLLAAGQPAAVLQNQAHCLEIMTGAVVPYDADTVIMYEDVEITHGVAHLNSRPSRGQNIHTRGSDCKKGELVLKRDRRICSADVGILASVGRTYVPVRKLPRIAVISTGDELVEVEAHPQAHQHRKSNAYQLFAALKEEQIHPLLLHVADDKDMIRQKLAYALEAMDVLLLSGGVSKGKFDFIPQVLQELGVVKTFHEVRQRPGKPFWFGRQNSSGALVFSFPGNPVSTYACFFRYFKDWLLGSLGLPVEEKYVILGEALAASSSLTTFISVRTWWEGGKLIAEPVEGNGSGDMMSLAGADGFVCLEPRESRYQAGCPVPFVQTRKLL